LTGEGGEREGKDRGERRRGREGCDCGRWVGRKNESE